MAPATSTWRCCQTRFENSGTNGVNARIICLGRPGKFVHLSLADCGDERTLPLALKNG